MPFGLNKQTLTIAPREDAGVSPGWVAHLETALLGRAQIERIDIGLEVTMFGKPEVVRKRLSRALRSALGEGSEALFVIRDVPLAVRPARLD